MVPTMTPLYRIREAMVHSVTAIVCDNPSDDQINTLIERIICLHTLEVKAIEDASKVNEGIRSILMGVGTLDIDRVGYVREREGLPKMMPTPPRKARR